MSTVASLVREEDAASVAAPPRDIRIALLGLGQVGSAVAALARTSTHASHRFAVASALVRSPERVRPIDPSTLPLTMDGAAALDTRPDVVVEVLGGLEPARTLVLAALARRIPVVTANKSLLAAHGDELIAAAARTSTPLLHEAAVLAGVPFLGTFSRRPLASDVTALSGIVNGTSNFILSRMAADRAGFRQALLDAQQAGYAEPEPSKDVDGDDATEKLCVLLRHFAGISVAPALIDRTGVGGVEPCDLECASSFGGAIRPIVAAEWESGTPSAFVGPAFVASSHPLSRIDGVQNAISLRTRWSGDVFFSGPGAGPTVTAATVLDDVVEAVRLGGTPPLLRATRTVTSCDVPVTGWFIRLVADDLSDAQRAPATLTRLGVRVRRVSPVVERYGQQRQWVLAGPCTDAHVRAALDVLETTAGCRTRPIRAIE
jgi:homoserine dehydrogenase